MIARLRDCLLALALAVMTGGACGTESRAFILREDTAIARQTSELIAAELARQGWSVSEASLGAAETRAIGDAAVIALGPKALAALPATPAPPKVSGGRAAVAALVTRDALDERPLPGGWAAIVLDQPPGRWASLVQMAFPGRRASGLLVGAAHRKWLPLLERKFQERQLALVEEMVASAEEVMPALERLLPRAAVLLALPDQIVHNHNTVQSLLLTTYRAGVPVVAYSEFYLQAGAAIALYSTPAQIAAHVVETVNALREGRAVAAVQAPRYFTVGVNATVARSLGLHLPSGSELKDKLRDSDQ